MHNHLSVVDTFRCLEHACKLWSRTIKWYVWSLWDLKHSRCGIQEFLLLHSSDPAFPLRENHHPKFHDYYLSDKKYFYHICRYPPHPSNMLFKFTCFWALEKFYHTVLNLLQLAIFIRRCSPDSSMWLYWAMVHPLHCHMTVSCGDMAQFIYPCSWKCTVRLWSGP